MGVQVTKLRGIPHDLKLDLQERGFRNSDQILAVTCTPDGRKLLAEQLGIAPEIVLNLANRADLARVSGIGGVFADLLEHAGIDTVKELATRRPNNLHAKLVEINNEIKLAGRAPTLKAVESWVMQAKDLPRALEY